MKNIVFTIIVFFSSFSLFAQSGKLKKADDLYQKLSYASASDLYEALLNSEVDSPELKSKLANCYFQVGKLKESEDLYAALVKGNVAKNDDLLAYSQVLKQNGKYEESDKWMKKYHSIVINDSRGKEFIENENYIQKIEKNGNKFSISNLQVNTIDADFGGYIFNKKAYFITSRYENAFVKTSWTWNEKKFLDLYRVELGDSQQFVNPKIHTKRVNTKFHEGPICFSADEKKVFYTRNNIANGSERRDQKGIQNLKIYIADVIQDNIWLNEREFVYNSKEYSIGHPSISADGKTLYFVSDMPGGVGGADIYRVQILEDEKFGEPENLGKTINTEGQEMFPFINNENLLFFSSDGHIGLGGLDVFVGIPSKNSRYEKILNVGKPVNSRRDDFAFVMDSTLKRGYFSSNRDGGKGDDDIYSYKLEKPFKAGNFFNGTIIDEKSGDILSNAKVVLKDLEGNILAEAVTDKEGKISLPVEIKKDYVIEITKEDYIDFSYNLALQEDSDMDEILKLKKDPGLQLYCLISEKSSGVPLENARITVFDLVTKEMIIDTVTTSSGSFLKPLFDKQLNDELKYEITLEKEGYLTLEKKFNFKIEKSGIINIHEILNVKMSKVDVGANLSSLIDINPIYFDLGKWYIRNDATIELDKVVEVMNKYPDMVIELGSHTDCRSSRAFNLKLSDKRAKSSAQYIKSKITNPKRIFGKGFGEAILINDCGCEGKKVTRDCSEEEHQANRRTEFIIKKIGVANVSVNTIKEQVKPKLEIDYTKKFHIVEESDNLYIISVNNGVSVEELIKINNLPSQKVTVGQKIMLRK
jgi:outer membrane protein OmpA-like peptidoglycan-associated protein/tetratricopeptide (TPR) repeat protein